MLFLLKCLNCSEWLRNFKLASVTHKLALGRYTRICLLLHLGCKIVLNEYRFIESYKNNTQRTQAAFS